MATRTYKKDPNATLDYAVDWSPWLGDDDALATSTFVVPAGLTKMSEGWAGDVAVVWLSGGTLGETYRVVCRITTSDGRGDDRSFLVKIEER